ncbi:MAG: chloride channel protein [Gammaproteobacteria bacterium]|nr:chloride channel protein [Gammaproteobacteria bacterium]
MGKDSSIRTLLRKALENLRLRTSRPDALIQLAILATLAGLMTGLVIISFRLLIEAAQKSFLPYGDPENYEGLPLHLRILLPIAGALLIAILYKLLARKDTSVGVSHVMERLSYHQGYLGIRNLALQYLGAAMTIISGQSLGREGPAIHLGAATSSLIGQQLGLPNNTIRTLVACGTAAAIGASFNTPLAGVIFALEVVMMEYSLASFLPVILSAVSATAVTRAVFGTEVVFSVPNFQLTNLLELPYVMFLGVITGIAAFVFIYLTRLSALAGKKLPIWLKFTIAGSITGLLAIVAPQIMGIGYDTVNYTLVNNIGLSLLLIIFAAKLIATACSIGLGLPAGLIGPTFVIGASLGGILGILAQPIFPELSSSPGMYALIGMAAMMGATLQAPLAALTAVFELTSNPNIILPGMLAIVTAQLTASQLFGQRSIYRMLMQLKGLDYRHEPMVQALRRVGVANVMNRNIHRSAKIIDHEKAEELVKQNKEWIVIEEDQPIAILPTSDLSNYLEDKNEEKVTEINLMEIPAKRLQVSCIDLRATADSAREHFIQEGVEALCISSTIGPDIIRVYGVLTKDKFKSSYDI